MSLRTTRAMISLLYHASVILICLLGFFSGIPSHSGNVQWFFLAVLLLHILTARINPLGRFIQEMIITKADCPGCGRLIELVAYWKCQCGFATGKPRHAFRPCPQCGRLFKWIDCPRCETSLLI